MEESDCPKSSGAHGSFFVLDNPGDPNFNQLLGINDGHVIVGYFGDGTAIPNNGYVLVPKNHYSVENFTNLPSGDFACSECHSRMESDMSKISSVFYRARIASQWSFMEAGRTRMYRAAQNQAIVVAIRKIRTRNH
jgi:hypothetical protein